MWRQRMKLGDFAQGGDGVERKLALLAETGESILHRQSEKED